jgi:hypothetical protein
MESTGADAVSEGVSSDAGGSELVEMHVAVLELCQSRDLEIAAAANRLKPTNCARELQIVRIARILGTNRTI